MDKKVEVTFDYVQEEFGGITAAMLEHWGKNYPAVDIAAEIRRAADWLGAEQRLPRPALNPKRFLVGWFTNAQARESALYKWVTFRYPQP